MFDAGIASISFISFEDPACIFPAFDTVLNYAWIVIAILTGIMLFGWAVLYIFKGVKLDTIPHNAKSLFLIFAVFALVKPIVNVVYGDNLFSQQCEIKQVSRAQVNELLNLRNKNFGSSDDASEVFARQRPDAFPARSDPRHAQGGGRGSPYDRRVRRPLRRNALAAQRRHTR